MSIGSRAVACQETLSDFTFPTQMGFSSLIWVTRVHIHNVQTCEHPNVYQPNYKKPLKLHRNTELKNLLCCFSRVYDVLINASQWGWGRRWWCLHCKYTSPEVVLLHTLLYMVKLERVFLSVPQGLASSSCRAWPVGMFSLMEVCPLHNVEHWVSVGLPLTWHGRCCQE